MSDVIDSQPRKLGRAGVVSSDAVDDEYDDLREWCDKMRTTWPQLDAEFLRHTDRQWASKLAFHHEHEMIDYGHFANGDFAWVSDVLVQVFSAELSPTRKLAVLQYFLSFVVELIMVDCESEYAEAARIHRLLRDAIEPAMVGAASEPPFLSILTPSADAEPAEAYLMEEIGISITSYLDYIR